MWQEFINVMSKLLEIYKVMLRISSEKRKVLVQVDMTALEDLLTKEQSLIAKVGKLEKEREIILQKIAAAEHIIEPMAKMADLFSLCNNKEAAVLKNIHEELNTIVAQVTENSATNELLISGALSAVNYNLNRLSDASVGPTYADKGQENILKTKKYDFQA
jgi:flagellar biosynthesis/type III secretory pathway chaperone